MPGQRSFSDSARSVHGRTRPPLASGTLFPIPETYVRPDHGRGGPAGAAHPALWVGGTPPPSPSPPRHYDGFIANRGHQHAHRRPPGGPRPHDGRRRRPTPAPLTNCTLLLLARLILVPSFFHVFHLLAVLHWTMWLSACYEQILTGCILDVCAPRPLLVVLRLFLCHSALFFSCAGLGFCLLMWGRAEARQGVRKRRGGHAGGRRAVFSSTGKRPQKSCRGPVGRRGGVGGVGSPRKLPREPVGRGVGAAPASTRRRSRKHHFPCNALDQGSATWTAGLRTGECFSVHYVTFFGQGGLRFRSRTQFLCVLRECRVPRSSKM